MESAAGGSSGNTSLRTLMFNDKIDTPNLGDFLRVKEDNNNNNLAGLTLGDVLSNKRESFETIPVHSNRSLLDIIRDDPTSSRKNRIWEHFKNKLRLRPAADAWTSNISIEQRNNPIISRRLFHDVFATYPDVENFCEAEISASESRSRILGIMGVENEHAEEESVGENAREEIGVELEDQPVRMPLMALLTENDGDGSAYVMEDDDEDEEGEEKDEEDVDDNGVTSASVGASACGEYNNCCVCMVRHKAAAFIPCGHTFCRLCSRELWVQRGNCPICNNFILEVLDIF